MTADDVIAQLKAYAPVFEGRVAGGAEWEQLTADQVWMDLPAAYVMQIEDEAEPNKNQTGLYQEVRQTVAVIVVLDNRADRRGQVASTDAVGPVKVALWRALLRWRPGDVNAANGFSYVRAGYLRSDRARLVWQFEFAITDVITASDGWQPCFEPLLEVQTTAIDDTTGQTLSVTLAEMPQPPSSSESWDKYRPDNNPIV